MRFEYSTAYQIYWLAAQINDGMLQARANELAWCGIPIMQAAVLAMLGQLGRPATTRELARMLLRQHDTVSQLLTRIEKRGLVQRQRPSGKRGPVRTSLTEQGEEALRQTYERRGVIDKIVSSCLPSEEQATLLGYLQRLRDATYSELAEKPAFP